jgi:hypothetical protein
MKYFSRINLVSMFYALIILIPFELMINSSRISIVTNWNQDSVNISSFIVSLVVFIIGTVTIFLVTKKWLNGGKLNFWTALLWIPYFVLFVYIIAKSFPPKNINAVSTPGAGLIAIGMLIAFPIYILLINYLDYMNNDESLDS